MSLKSAMCFVQVRPWQKCELTFSWLLTECRSFGILSESAIKVWFPSYMYGKVNFDRRYFHCMDSGTVNITHNFMEH